MARLFHFQSTPSAATYDEVIYLAEAQSIVKYGTDLKGTWKPWFLEPSDSYYTELTSTVLTPGFILFPNNPILAGKFVPLLLGSLIPVLLGLLAYRLRKEKRVFIATTVIATLNPWIFQFTRMGYDSLFSIGFYLMGMVSLLYFKKWRKLWSVAPLFLGFFQYQGHKPLLVPLIFLCLIFLILEKTSIKDEDNSKSANKKVDQYKIKNFLKQLKKNISNKNILATIVIFIFSILLTIIYLVRLPNLTSSQRSGEFQIFDPTALSSKVNDWRRMSLSTPLNSLYINKYSVLATELTDKFLNSFDFKRLFIEGDARVDTFSVLDYGYFHLIDILVIVIGLGFIVANKKDYRVLFFVLSFIVIGAIPNTIRIGDPWIYFRGAFVFLGIVLLMGIGSASFLELFSKRMTFLFVAIYLITTTPFFFIYFFRYPITHTKNVGFYERVVASYIDRINSQDDVYILPDRDDATFNYQIHYNHLLSQSNREQASLAINDREFEINNLKIEGGCSQSVLDLNDVTVFVFFTKDPCVPNHDPNLTTQIKSLTDSGTIFTIYNDKLCSQYTLNPYPNIKKNVMAVESLSNQEFCENLFSTN